MKGGKSGTARGYCLSLPRLANFDLYPHGPQKLSSSNAPLNLNESWAPKICPGVGVMGVSHSRNTERIIPQGLTAYECRSTFSRTGDVAVMQPLTL